MTADHTPSDETVLRQPAAYEADFRSMFREPGQAPLSFTAWSPITVSDKTVTQQPAAPPGGCAMTECTDHSWYSTQRAKVEADHAAKRNAWPRHCHSPSSCTRHGACMYMNCRHEGQDIRPAIAAHAAAKETTSGSIDMGLLGKLCREEPDADTKREVAEMMDGLTGRIGAQP